MYQKREVGISEESEERFGFGFVFGIGVRFGDLEVEVEERKVSAESEIFRVEVYHRSIACIV